MTKFQNMKIEINEQQPLDEVAKELKKLGYKKLFDPYNIGGCVVVMVITWDNGRIDFSTVFEKGDTTLAQLKAMEE